MSRPGTKRDGVRADAGSPADLGRGQDEGGWRRRGGGDRQGPTQKKCGLPGRHGDLQGCRAQLSSPRGAVRGYCEGQQDEGGTARRPTDVPAGDAAWRSGADTGVSCTKAGPAFADASPSSLGRMEELGQLVGVFSVDDRVLGTAEGQAQGKWPTGKMTQGC